VLHGEGVFRENRSNLPIHPDTCSGGKLKASLTSFFQNLWENCPRTSVAEGVPEGINQYERLFDEQVFDCIVQLLRPQILYHATTEFKFGIISGH